MRRLVSLTRKLYGYTILLLRGGVAFARWQGVKVGEECRVYTSHFGSEPFLITIGDRVTVTSGVRFVTHDGSTWLIRDSKGRRYLYRPISIGSDVFIGVNSVIMPGVRIGNNVIVGSGSVVTRSVPSGVIVAGVPARIIMNFEDYKYKVINNFVSQYEFDKLRNVSYEEAIMQLADMSFKPEMDR